MQSRLDYVDEERRDTILSSLGPEALERFLHLVYVLRGILDVVLSSEGQQVRSGYILELPPHGEFVTSLRSCGRFQDEA